MNEEIVEKEWGSNGRVLELKLPKYRAVFYTDTVANKQACRDDLWAVSTDELNAIHAELTRLRAIAKEYADMEDWLRKNHGYFDYMSEDDSFQFTRELPEDQRHFAHGKTLLEAYRKCMNLKR